MTHLFRIVTATLLLVAATPVLGAGAGDPIGFEHTLDGELVRVVDTLPGFGGVFVDALGQTTVYLTDLGRAAEARKEFPGARVVQGQYDFRQLSGWRADLRPALAAPGVVLLDVDETRNRVRIGVDAADPGAADAVALELKLAGVPAGAVIVESVEPVMPLATLTSKFRPAPAGVQINFGSYVCTLGVNAYRSGVFGFLTNSHCTNVQGGVESTRYYQPNTTGGAVATETVDPTYSTASPCPSGRRCRWSDAAFARYDTTSLGALREIARTTARGTTSGSLTVSTTNPRFFITSKVSFPVAGEYLDKMGRTTGWTFGQVNSTCVDTNVGGTNITLYCQDHVSAGSGGGDSGSPVFRFVSGSSNVPFYGLLWGGSGSSNFVFSSVWNIERELGTITVF